MTVRLCSRWTRQRSTMRRKAQMNTRAVLAAVLLESLIVVALQDHPSIWYRKGLLQNLDTLHEGQLLLMHWAICVPESLVPESLRISWHDLCKTFIWCLPVSGRPLCIWNLRRSIVIRAISIPTDNCPQVQEIQTIDQVWHHLTSSHDLFPIFGISRLCRNSGEAFFEQGHFWLRGVSGWCEH